MNEAQTTPTPERETTPALGVGLQRRVSPPGLGGMGERIVDSLHSERPNIALILIDAIKRGLADGQAAAENPDLTPEQIAYIKGWMAALGSVTKALPPGQAG